MTKVTTAKAKTVPAKAVEATTTKTPVAATSVAHTATKPAVENGKNEMFAVMLLIAQAVQMTDAPEWAKPMITKLREVIAIDTPEAAAILKNVPLMTGEKPFMDEMGNLTQHGQQLAAFKTRIKPSNQGKGLNWKQIAESSTPGYLMSALMTFTPELLWRLGDDNWKYQESFVKNIGKLQEAMTAILADAGEAVENPLTLEGAEDLFYED